MPASGSHRYFQYQLGMLLAWMLCAACSKPADTQRNSANRTSAVEVVTAPATVKTIGVELEAVGTARARESVEVTSKAADTVSAIYFESGDQVRRGEVLVELDNLEEQAALAEAEAALADSESQFKRSRDLHSQHALSAAQLEQIEATLKGNRARVAAAKARLADTVIRAAFNGRTGFRRVSVGSLITPGSVITTLDDTSIIKVDFTVPETYFYVLKTGLPVTAATAGLPDRTFTGQVTEIESRVDPVTRSITVRAEIPNPDGVLRPGMFMTVTLQGEPAPALMIPEGAVIPEQGSTFAFVARDGVAQRVEIRTGKRRPGEVEVTAGLKAGDRVVVEGTQKIRDGDRVQEAPDAPSS